MRIKTIMQGGDPAVFDRQVNACLMEGWELVEYGPRQVGPVNWSMYAALVYHEAEKQDAVNTRRDQDEIDPIKLLSKISAICARHDGEHCGQYVGDEKNTCPLWGWCRTRARSAEEPFRWTFPEEYEL